MEVTSRRADRRTGPAERRLRCHHAARPAARLNHRHTTSEHPGPAAEQRLTPAEEIVDRSPELSEPLRIADAGRVGTRGDVLGGPRRASERRYPRFVKIATM